MATTTPNYGWTVPTSTDLVKDGATAIETLGDSVDATVKALNPETTLGDIAYRSSTANTNTRLGIGTSGQVLSVSGGVPAWTTPASGGGMTDLASGSLSGSSLDLSSISGSYNDLVLVLRGMTYSASVTSFSVLANTISDYTMNVLDLSNATFQTDGGSARGSISPFYNTMIAAQTGSALRITVYDYANTTSWKHVTCQFVSTYAGPNISTDFTYATVKSTAAITRLRANPGGGTYSTGTYTLYGVK
jgi:hypothetical protein